MSEQTLLEGLFDLIGYMLTSARGLVDEPRLYGPFRLVDGVSKLCTLFEHEDIPRKNFYTKLRKIIDEGKFSVMTDEKAFIGLLDELVLLYTQKRVEG
jgi:hypothetical protein